MMGYGMYGGYGGYTGIGAMGGYGLFGLIFNLLILVVIIWIVMSILGKRSFKLGDHFTGSEDVRLSNIEQQVQDNRETLNKILKKLE